MTYLDYNATAPLRPEVVERMAEVMAVPANASSVHAAGRRARKIVEDARDVIAQAVSAFRDEVIFCASGTEANNMALRGLPGAMLFCSAIEHPSVLKGVESSHSIGEGIVPVTSDGVIDLGALEKLLESFTNREPRATSNILLSLMLANNETGVIQPVEQAVKIAKKYGVRVHCDAVQALGKIPVDFGRLGVDMLAISAHKMGGPQGAAALVVRRDLAIKPLLVGGGQELGRRAGTENVAAIAGFARAVERAADTQPMAKLRLWRDAMEADITACCPFARVAGGATPRLPNTSCLLMPGVGAETQLMHFDLAGIAVSAGSACSSGKVQASHVLQAMGISAKDAAGAIRVSGGWNTTQQEMRSFAVAWKKLWARLGGNAKGAVA